MAINRSRSVASTFRGVRQRRLPAKVKARAEGNLGEGTLKRLEEYASDTFKREVDLDESVWRSLPFIAATFAFVAAVVGKASVDVPRLSLSFYSLFTGVLLLFAVAALAWSLRWFYVLLRPREYEYPARIPSVQTYAEEISDYHAALGLEGEELDAKAVEELRLFMVAQYASAVGTNQGLNAVRFEARGKVLLFMLAGFVLAFSCEATIFINRSLYGASEVQNGEATERQTAGVVRAGENVRATPVNDAQGGSVGTLGQVRAGTPIRPEVAAGYRGGQPVGLVLEDPNSGEALMAKGPVKPTTAGSPPQRPTSPPTQVVAKFNDGSRNQTGSTKPTPKPTSKK